MLFFPCIPEAGIMKVNKETAYKPQGIRKEFLMRDALRDEMIKKICVRDTDNILDVGCGDGTFLHELTRWKDVEGYGIDESEDKILIAKQTWPELHFETGYSDFLSFDDNSFRVITVCDDFHTFKDPQKFVNEAFRVLVPGGRLYIGESALLEALRIVSNIPSYLTSGDDRRHSTYETLEYFKNAGLTKFRVYKKKRLLLISAKKPLE